MKKQKKKKFWEMRMSADGESGDIFIYGDIERYQWIEEDTTASSFRDDLDNLGDVSTINLYINSPGGSVFEGVAIHNMLKRHEAKVNVRIDALAASIASVIAMAGDTIYMPKNSMLMIHNPWTIALGNAKELRKTADDLDRIGGSAVQSYLQKAGDKLTEEKLQEMLDEETWLSADEAYQYGLADVVEEENQMAASINKDFFAQYKNVPDHLMKEEKSNQLSAEELAERQRIADEAKANSEYINDILGGI
ncbi:ATP-dependent Clp endopeptidase, proteolytic subunit ClpP [Alteribacillus persepolensis]|uniref:ATP-dependent Clp protease proteolytic subunit n=1 Tax=Alteribacillus persepolensis TaxID=568899 RepID=A0A1G8IJS3_9BACI|nr:head maturation protease, ClpP-related [Alteribacillus persepolensis]SDI19037.1 ATP-dependent Clp endopeptidase, proteolytic subunit ClpP [Alteribacillus persepolensis]